MTWCKSTIIIKLVLRSHSLTSVKTRLRNRFFSHLPNSVLTLQVFTGLRLHCLFLRPQFSVSSVRTLVTFSHSLLFIDECLQHTRQQPQPHQWRRPDLKTAMHKTCHTALVLLLGGSPFFPFFLVFIQSAATSPTFPTSGERNRTKIYE